MDFAFAFFLVLAVLFVLCIAKAVNSSKKENEEIVESDGANTLDVESFLLQTLKSLNIEVENLSEDDRCFFNFDFQEGHFFMVCPMGDLLARLTFPGILTAKAEYLSTLLYLCNHKRYFGMRPVVRFDEKDNEYAVDVICDIDLRYRARAREFLKDVMQQCFSVQRYFCHEFENAKKNYDESNIQENIDGHARDMYLLVEHEISQQKDADDVCRANADNVPSVGQMLETFMAAGKSMDISEMKVVGAETTTLTEYSDIVTYDILSPLRDGGLDEVTYVIKCPEETVVVHVRSHSVHKFLHYYKVSSSDFSFLVSYDERSEDQRQAEFDFRWKEAQEGGAHEDDPHKMIAEVRVRELAWNLYWGTKCYRDRLCYEAIPYLKKAYAEMRALNRAQKAPSYEDFAEVCYMLGFCYMDLNQHERAAYYLDIVFSRFDMRYDMEYINALCNMDDIRALSLVRSRIETIKEMLEKPDVGESMLHFYHFLIRREVYMMINEQEPMEKIMEALSYLNRFPENQDFVRNELACLGLGIEDLPKEKDENSQM